jgi:hypothetical protein
VALIGDGEHVGALGAHQLRLPVVNVGGGVVADARVPVLLPRVLQ